MIRENPPRREMTSGACVVTFVAVGNQRMESAQLTSRQCRSNPFSATQPDTIRVHGVSNFARMRHLKFTEASPVPLVCDLRALRSSG
jgi:hypothetical protein